MSPEFERRVEEVFRRLVELPADKRVTCLDRVCAGDADLRREVESLLAADQEASGFLAEPAPSLAFVDEDDPDGWRLGPYEIVRRIGVGGMSTVYLARRSDGLYRQHVAVKVVRDGFHRPELLRRFRNERQILASLDHPNIAQLHDAGHTREGLPYFVMEHVEGIAIHAYCDRHRLTVAERLRLVRRVCAAVQYAHQNLVVHRDIKPGNILVTEAGVTKLLDFGIAKVLKPEAFPQTVEATATGLRLMTPCYASPEQVRGERITAASDVYSLGVLLYEILAGRLPYRLETGRGNEIERRICDEEPKRLSLAVFRKDKLALGGKEAPSPEAIARSRRVRPEQLRRQLAGDLDNILQMALRKSPHERYGSAQQLSEDLRRHLEGLTVAARPDTPAYRLGKFVRRHRLAVTVAALFTATIVGFSTVTAFQAMRLARERDQAQLERDTTREVLSFLTGVFEISDPTEARGDTITAREVLDQGAERLATQLEDRPTIRAILANALGGVYRGLGLYTHAEEQLATALDLRQRVLGPEHPSVAESLNESGLVQFEKGDLEAAEAFYREALGILLRDGAEDPLLAEARSNLAAVLQKKGELAAAEELYRQALAQQMAQLGESDLQIALTLNNLAALYQDQGRYQEAEKLYRQVLGRQRELAGVDHPDVAITLNNLGALLMAQGQPEAAEPLLRECLGIWRRVYGDEHPNVAAGRVNLAQALQESGNLDDAEPLLRQALRRLREHEGGKHFEAATLINLAGLLALKGELEAAEKHYREALDVQAGIFGEESIDFAVVLVNLANLLAKKGDPAAEGHYRRALSLQRRLLGQDHPDVAWTQSQLAGFFHDRGDIAAAEPLYREALRLRRRALDANHPDIAGTLRNLGLLLAENGDPEQAEPLLRKALAIWQRTRPPGDWKLALARNALGDCLRRLGRIDTARDLLESSLPVLEEQLGAEHGQTRKARRRLAELDRATGAGG